MGNIVSATTPFAHVRREGSDLVGYITQPWFRYLVSSGPEGNGGTGQLLHGNSSGAPTWGPVDLAHDVTGELPFANGGLGGIPGVSGGVLAFTGASMIASSPMLTHNAIVFGGGAGATPSTPLALGGAGQVLHANPSGTPTWAAVRLDNLAGEVTGILPITNGGTGTTLATGVGNVVLQSNATLFSPALQFASFTLPMTLTGTSTGSVFNATDPRVVSVGALQTLIIPQDYTFFFIAHDKTSGGCSIGTMDRSGVSMVLSGISGVTFTRAAASGLQAQVTSGATPRSISIFAFGIGPI